MPLPHQAQTIFQGMLCIIAVLVCLYISQDIVLPVVLAFVLKLLLQPLVSLLQRFRVSIHVIEGEIVTPLLLANRFTINPLAVNLSLIFWYWSGVFRGRSWRCRC
jgi:predicted PurR-regulated permease PerM